MRATLLGCLVVLVSVVSPPALAKNKQEPVCHWDSASGSYKLLNVPTNSAHFTKHAQDVAPDANGQCGVVTQPAEEPPPPPPPPAPATVTLIDSTADWDGVQTWQSMCGSGAWGQTFTLAQATELHTFSFFLQTTPPDPWGWNPPMDPVTFRAQIVAWDPGTGTAVGPVLFESPSYTTTSTLAQYVFNTGGITLPAGTYAAVVNGGGLGNTWSSGAALGIAPWFIGDPYGGGTWNDAYTGGNWIDSQCTNSANPAAYWWYVNAQDLAFIATGLVP